MCNEFLGDDDIKNFENMKERHPHRYNVEGLGDWGRIEGTVYNNWEMKDFDWRHKYLNEFDRNGNQAYQALFGMDFGFTTDPTAFIGLLASVEKKEIWVFAEEYKRGWKNTDIVKDLRYKEYHKTRIIADSEDPRTIDALRDLGLPRITGARKGRDSVRAGINKLQEYKIFVHPTCENTEIELKNHSWAVDKFGKSRSVPADDGYDHLLDALRYATENLGEEMYSFK
jgi:phage terminase large subunit